MTFMMPIMMLIMNGVSVAIIYFGAHGVDNGTMQVGNMMGIYPVRNEIIMSFLMITSNLHYAPKGKRGRPAESVRFWKWSHL